MGVEFVDQPLGLLSELARRELVHILESMSGNKDLVVDATLLRPLDRVANMTLLHTHGVLGVLPLRKDSVLPWNPQVTRRVYLLRSSLEMAKAICRFVRSEPDRQMAVIWVDRKQHICSRELERQGVHGVIDEFEWSFSFITIESDLFSLELPMRSSSRSAHLYSAAQALWQLQSLYGQIPTVYGIGDESEKTWRLIRNLYLEKGEPRASPDQPISHLFVLDRNMDHGSVLLTGLNYESMLHDTFTIGSGKIVFGTEVETRLKPTVNEAQSTQNGTPQRAKVTLLDNNDGVFASVRNKHMTAVFPFLSSKAKEIQTSYDKGSTINQVQDMKQFVSHELKSLKQQHRQLETHICACEVVLEQSNSVGASDRLSIEHSLISGSADMAEVMSFLEDCMLKEHSPWQILLLVCLASITNNGLPSKMLNSFKDQFLSSYGFDYLPVLHSLTSRFLLTERPRLGNAGTVVQQLPTTVMGQQNIQNGSPTLPYLIRRLSLTPSSTESTVDLRNPTTMNYVFSGAYTPALCQVVSDAMVHGWNTAELKKTFNGQVFVEENSYIPADRKPDSRMKKAIMVFFVGGVTYAEVAALRLLAVQNNFRILIGASNIVHRETYIKCFCDVDLA